MTGRGEISHPGALRAAAIEGQKGTGRALSPGPVRCSRVVTRQVPRPRPCHKPLANAAAKPAIRQDPTLSPSVSSTIVQTNR
jgi:hypothetical protein